MPQICKVCNHIERGAVELAIATRSGSKRAIAARFGISKDALLRHIEKHVDPKIEVLAVRQESLTIEAIIAQVSDIQAKMQAAYERAELAGASNMELAKLAREIRENALALARLAGLLKEGHGTYIDNRSVVIQRQLETWTEDELRQFLARTQTEMRKLPHGQ